MVSHLLLFVLRAAYQWRQDSAILLMQYRVMPHRPEKSIITARNPLARLLLVGALLACGRVNAQLPETTLTLQQLTDQRLMLTAELDLKTHAG